MTSKQKIYNTNYGKYSGLFGTAEGAAQNMKQLKEYLSKQTTI